VSNEENVMIKFNAALHTFKHHSGFSATSLLFKNLFARIGINFAELCKKYCSSSE